MPEKKSDGSQSLTRGIRLIEFLSDYPNGCPLARIAESTGLNKSTAHRLLATLQHLGYVALASPAGSYRITSRFASMGFKAMASLNILGVAAPHLEKMNLDTGDTVNFAAREGNYCVLIYKLEPTTGMLRTRAYIGQRMKLYCSGMGKVFLAFSPDGYLEKYWNEEQAEIVRYTSNTIVDVGFMRHELARIRGERIAFDREENELGIGCVAAPVFGLNRRVDHALSVSIPTTRLDDRRRLQLAEIVSATAQAISREIGGEEEIIHNS